MFNKKRIIIFFVFILLMFFMMTFAGTPIQNAAISTRSVIFTDGFNGKDIASYEVEVGEDVKVPEDPYHKNYVFAGWFDYDDRDVRVTNFTNILSNIHVIALYGDDINNNGINDEDDTYFSVSFVNSINNRVLKTQKVLIGMDATAPNAPKVDGYTFRGWDTNYTNVRSNLTVRTIYNRNNTDQNVKTYNVTFVDGDTKETISVVKVNEGASAKPPKAPTHEGRVFSKWEGSYTNVKSNQTVTAIYVDDKNNNGKDDEEEKVAIRFNAGENGNIDGKTTITTEELYLPGYDNYPTSPKVTPDKDYKFDGWNPTYNEGKQIPLDNPTLEFTAKYFADKNNNDIDDETELVSITFNAGNNGKVNGESSYKTEKIYLPGYDKYPAAPTVTPNKNYGFKEWDPAYSEGEEIALENPILEFNATYFDDKNNNGVDDETEKVTITFNAGNNGTIDGETSKTIENLLPGYDKYPASPVVTPNEDYKFNGWNPTYTEGETISLDNPVINYTAQYFEDKNNNNTDDETEEHFTVTFLPGSNGTLEGTSKFENILTGLTFEKAGIVVPTIKANENYKVKSENAGWDKALVTTVTENATYTAQYFADFNNNDVDDETEKVTLTFNAGNNGTIDGETTKTIENLLPGYDKYPAAPTVTPNEDYKFNGWNPTYTEGETISLDNPVINYTAQYFEDKNNNDKDDEEEDHFTVEFLPGRNGTLEGTSKFENILTGLTFEKAGIVVPTIKANENYKVKSENAGWDKEVVTTVTENATYTAQYFADFNNNDVDDETEKVTLTFNAGNNGTIDGETTKTIENLLPGYDKYPAAPTVVPNENYKFNGWNPTYTEGETISLDNPVINFEATYFEDKNNNNVDDETEKVTLTFKAGDHGNIAGETSKKVENLLPGYDKYPAAPEVTADTDYKFKEWTPAYTADEMIPLNNATLEYTATYFEDKNNNDIDDETELVSLTFNGGDHGNINGSKSYTTEKIYLPGYDKYPQAPEVTVDEDYKFSTWEPTYTEGEEIALENPTLEFTAKYYEDKNNNDVDDNTEKVTLTFKAGDHGNIAGETSKKVENLLPGYDKYPAAPEVTADTDYKFKEWTPAYTANEMIPLENPTLEYTATYFEDKNNNNVDDETEKVTLTFKAGEHGNIAGEASKTVENLLPGYDKYPAAPEVTADIDYKFKEWTPAYTADEMIPLENPTLEYTATYFEDKNNNNVDDNTEKVTLTFKAGDHGNIAGEATKTVENLLPGYDKYPAAPEVTADTDYKFKEWTPAYTANEMIPLENPTLEYTATYFEDKNNNNVDDETEKVTLTFKAGDHGNIAGETSKKVENLLPGYDKYPAAPEVTADTDYKFKEWTPAYTANEMIPLENPTLEYTATYFEDKNNNNVDDETEKVTLTFKAGEHGNIAGEASKTVENLLPGYDKYPAAPEVTADTDYKFKEWTPAYTADEMIPLNNATLEYTATYFEDKNNNDIDDETELVSLTFNGGDHGNINGSKSYTTEKIYLPGYDKYPQAPEVTVDEEYKFSTWEPTYTEGEEIALENPTLEFTAKYYEDKNNNGVDDNTEKVTLTFKVGDHGNIAGEASKTVENLLPGYDKYPQAPEVTADTDYKFKEWTPAYTADEMIPLNNATLEYTATYFEDKNNNDIDDETEEHFTVEFLPGSNGTLEGKSKYENILTGLTFEKVGIVVPTIKPNENYKVKSENAGWDKALVTTVTANATYTAQYFADFNNNNVDDETEKVTLTFKAGDHGNIAGEATKTVENLLPGYDKYPQAPEVTADTDYKFKEWTPAYTANEMIPLENPTLEYTATYFEDKNNNDIDDEEEDHFIVEFLPGSNGTLEGKSKYENILTGLTFEKAGIVVPTIKPNENYKVKSENAGWDKALVTTVTANATYTAQYFADFNNNNVDDETEKVTLTFKAGDHGNIAGEATKTVENLLPGYDKYPAAPEVTADTDYKFKEWTPAYTANEMIPLENPTLEYTATYFEDKNNNDIDDETEEHFTVEFLPGSNGTLEGKSKYENILTGLTFEKAGIVVPTIKPNENYKVKSENAGWDKALVTTVTANATYTAQYFADFNNNNVDDETEKVTLTFKAGDHGNIAGEATKTVENLLPGYDKYPAAPEVTADTDYKFKEWTPAYTANEMIPLENPTLEYTATYFEDKNNNDIDDEEEDHFIVEFLPGSNGTLEGKSKYENILTGLTFEKAGIVVPTIKANENYKVKSENAGWDKALVTTVTANATYTAQYFADFNNNNVDDETEKVTLTFKAGDHGNIAGETSKKVENLLPGYDKYPAAPEVTADTDYKFKEWTPAYTANEMIPLENPTLEYTATYFEDKNNNDIDDEEEDHFIVEFLPGSNGTLEGKSKYENILTGLTFEKAGIVVPTIKANENYKVKSENAGWDKALVTTVTANATYTAQYFADFNNNNVDDETERVSLKFNAGNNGTIGGESSLTTEKIYLPGYDKYPQAPEVTANTGYTFNGWTPAYTANEMIPLNNPTLEFTADITINTYTVTFNDDDNSLISTQTVNHGDKVTPVDNPTKEATQQYTYTFAGWVDKDNNIVDLTTYVVTDNVIFTAKYNSVVNKYLIKFVDEDGSTVLDSKEFEYGATPTTSVTPTKEGNAQYSYTFAGWTPEIVSVTGEATYKATYTQSVNKYLIKFVDEDGSTVLDSKEFEYGATPTTSVTPTKEGDAQYSYTFAGWTPEIVSVTGAATYTATYNTEVNKYSFTINKYKDGTKFDTITDEANYGSVIQSSTYATAISHYKLDNATPESITISENEENNVINIYYVSIHANIEITTEVSGLDNNGNIEYDQEITYKITIKNTGDDTGNLIAHDKEIAKAIEDGLVVIKSGASEDALAIVSNEGLNLTIEPNENRVITLTVIVKANAGDKVSSQISYNVNDEGEKTADKVTVSVEKTISFIQKTETLTGTNIVVVLDKSASMDGDLIRNAKSATNQFIDKVFPNSNNNANSVLTVVTFGTKSTCELSLPIVGCVSYNNPVPFANVIGTATSYSEASTLKGKVNNIGESTPKPGSGTPYYIGLKEAYEILYGTTNLSQNGNKNVVVFLSDGAPDDNDNESLRTQYINNLRVNHDTLIYSIGYGSIQVGDDAYDKLLEVSGSASRTYTAGISGLLNVFNAIHENISDNNAPTQTEEGVAEMGNEVYVDAEHPLIINVNGSQAHSYTSLESALSSGYIFYEDNKYDVDATKFEASDNIQVIYFKSIANRTRTTKSMLKSIRGITGPAKDVESDEIEVVEIPNESNEEKLIETKEVENTEVVKEEKEESKEEVKEDNSSASSTETLVEENKEEESKEEVKEDNSDASSIEASTEEIVLDEKETTKEEKTTEVETKTEEKKNEVVEEIVKEEVKEEVKQEEKKETVKEEVKEEKKETTKEEKTSEKKETTKKEESNVTTNEEKITEVESEEETE